MRGLDPITLAVIQNGLMAVANEMDLTQEKLSFSPIISEAMDRANGLYRSDNGKLIVQGNRALPLFIGVMQASTQAIMKANLKLQPDDVVIVNDPYDGGTHLMDVRMLQPFFYQGQLWCYLSNTAHWADVGGAVPGGFSSTTTEIQQEGLRIPAIKICRNGKLDDRLLDLILSNCRIPQERVGDFKAQLAALSVGKKRLTALLDRYGLDIVDMTIRELETYSEAEMRSRIRSLPEGTFEFECQLDSDGVVDEPLIVALSLTIRSGEMYLDFSRSSKPCKGPLNVPWATTQSAVYVAVKHMFPDVWINAGCFVPINIIKPEDTFLCATYPSPVAGAAAEGSQRVLEAVMGAFAKAVPDRAYAGAFGTAGNISLGGFDPRTGRRFVMYYFTGGGYGGTPEGDGHSNACATISFAATQPIEILEKNYPVIFEYMSLREGSGGRGKRRGGLGVTYRLRLLRGEASASFMMDHGKFAPFAVLGGSPGYLTEILVSQSGTESRPVHISKGSGFVLRPGDWIQVSTPGGGGYGSPHHRATADVQRDIDREYISIEQAVKEYGYAGV